MPMFGNPCVFTCALLSGSEPPGMFDFSHLRLPLFRASPSPTQRPVTPPRRDLRETSWLSSREDERIPGAGLEGARLPWALWKLVRSQKPAPDFLSVTTPGATPDVSSPLGLSFPLSTLGTLGWRTPGHCWDIFVFPEQAWSLPHWLALTRGRRPLCVWTQGSLYGGVSFALAPAGGLTGMPGPRRAQSCPRVLHAPR